MDSKDHPVVQQGIKAAEIISGVSWWLSECWKLFYLLIAFCFQIPYKEDWEAEKQLVYYPVHITPGYEASSDIKKVQSEVSGFSVFLITATINSAERQHTGVLVLICFS